MSGKEVQEGQQRGWRCGQGIMCANAPLSSRLSYICKYLSKILNVLEETKNK